MNDFEFINGTEQNSDLGNVFFENALNSPLIAMGNSVASSSPLKNKSSFFTNTNNYTADFDDTRANLNLLAQALKRRDEKSIFDYRNYTLADNLLDQSAKAILPAGIGSIYSYTDVFGTKKTGAFYPTRLNKRLDRLESDFGFRINIDVDSKKASFTLIFYYYGTKQFRKTATDTSNPNDFRIDDKYKAIILETENSEAFLSFLEASVGSSSISYVESVLERKFKEAYVQVKTINNPDLIYWYYSIVPERTVVKHSEKTVLYSHLASLFQFNRENSFVDAASPLMKVLRAITRDAEGIHFLYNQFFADQQRVKDIYGLLSTSGFSYLHNEPVPHKTFFVALIQALCFEESERILSSGINISSIPTFKISENYRIDSNAFFEDKYPDQFDLRQEKKFIETIPDTRFDVFEKPSLKLSIGERTVEHWEAEGPIYSLSPMAMVRLEVTQSSGITVVLVVPAIYIKDIAYHQEWQRILDAIRLIADILIVFASVITALALPIGLATAVSLLDFATAIADLNVLSIQGELSKTPEGRKFLENWNTFVSVSGGLSLAAVLPDLLISGGKLMASLGKQSLLLIDKVASMLKLAILTSKNLAVKIRGNITIYTNALLISDFHVFDGLASGLYTMQKEGVLMIKVDDAINGVAQTKYMLVYNEAVIVESQSIKQLANDIEPFFKDGNRRGTLLKEALQGLNISKTKIKGFASDFDNHMQFLEVKVHKIDGTVPKYLTDSQGNLILLNGKKQLNPNFTKETYTYFAGSTRGKSIAEISPYKARVEKVTGLHLYPAAKTNIRIAEVIETKTIASGQKAIVAKVEAFIDELGAWKAKTGGKGRSTLFPKNWSFTKIKRSTLEASKNIIFKEGNKCVGKSRDGILIEFWINDSKQMINSYPVLSSFKIYLQ